MWSARAELVFFVNFILLGIGCIIYIGVIILTILNAPYSLDPIKYLIHHSPLSETLEDNPKWKPYRNQILNLVFVVAVSLSFAVPFIRLSIDYFLTRTLYTACDSGSEVAVAIKKACLWRNIHIFFLLFYPLQLISYFISPQVVIVIYHIIAFIWRIVEIIIVDKFINEMRQDSLRARHIVDNSRNVDNRAQLSNVVGRTIQHTDYV